MTKLVEYALMMSIITLGLFGAAYVADKSIARQDIICQEGC